MARPDPRSEGSRRILDFAMCPRMIPGMDPNGPRIKQARDAMASLDVFPEGLTGPGPGTGTGRGTGAVTDDEDDAAGLAGN